MRGRRVNAFHRTRSLQINWGKGALFHLPDSSRRVFFLIGIIIFSAFMTKKGNDIRASVRGKQVALGSANVNIFKLLCSVTCSKQLSLSSQSQSGSVMGDGSLHHGRRVGSLPGWHTCSVKGVAPNGTNSGQPWSLSETVSFLKR